VIPESLIRGALRRSVSHVTVEGVLYRVEGVSAVKLAGVGLAYLEGMAAARPEVETDAEANIRAESANEEEAAERIAKLQTAVREKAMRAHRAVLATPEGAAAYHQRVRAYVCAGVTGIGEAPEAIGGVVDGVPGVEHHGSDWSPPVELARVKVVPVDECPEDVPMEDALRAHAASDEWPFWAIPPTHAVILSSIISQLAGGRADVVAPFRVGSGAGGEPTEAG